jgi:thioredoxin reductase/ferredoxin
MVPAGDFRVTGATKEALLDDLHAQSAASGIEPVEDHAESVRRRGELLEIATGSGRSYLARRVILALGRSGNFRRLDIPGETLDKVFNRLHDPGDFKGRKVLVVGGGDSALEAAIALALCGARVTLCHRRREFSRPKRENTRVLERLAAPRTPASASDGLPFQWSLPGQGGHLFEGQERGTLTLHMETRVREIREDVVVLEHAGGGIESLPNDVVFTMLGREAPLDFFRRSGIEIAGEWNTKAVAGLIAFFVFCVALYNWKSGGALSNLFYSRGWFPTSLAKLGGEAADVRTLLGTLAVSASTPAFWYTLAYCAVVVVFGAKRIRRRRTPYVTAQTLTLMAIQVFPLFLLPEVILPLLHHNGLLPQGLADALFPPAGYGHGREFWRAYGFVLAWPLNVYNVFTDSPILWWLVISFAQTFVIIPLLIYFYGKGAYCGWICSCGALAETLGDTQRHKMPHGPRWNRANMAGQAILAVALILLGLRIYGWIFPGGVAETAFAFSKEKYKWIVDVFLAGAVGYGLYFWLSGRVWCRFLCPLAALMHIYARFSRFRILADKKKCISCNVCTSVCHQGIDIMSFANKGLPMADPECVRCSACVQSCPTGVLSFGQVDHEDGRVIRLDRLAASPVRIREP